MPSFRGISCSILLGVDKQKAIECGEVVDKDTNTVSVYAQIRDGPFAIDIVPTEFIYGGLGVKVEIDGKQQLERDSRGILTPTNHHNAFEPIDSVVYYNYGRIIKIFSRCWMFSSVQDLSPASHSARGETLGTIVLKFWRRWARHSYIWANVDDICRTNAWQHPPAVSASDISEHSLSHLMSYGPEERFGGGIPGRCCGEHGEIADSGNTPYATFIFKYRSREVLESKLPWTTAATAPPTTESEQRIAQLEKRVALFERITAKRKLRKERRARRETIMKDLGQEKTTVATKSREMKAKEQDMKARKKEMDIKKKELEANKKKFEAEEEEFKQKKGDWEREKEKLGILQRKLADIKKEEAEDDEELTDMEGEAA